jgi:short-subunit dehydrogenase
MATTDDAIRRRASAARDAIAAEDGVTAAVDAFQRRVASVETEPRRERFGTRRGDSAMVTGASSGIGETFARTLAARGVDVLLTAHPAEAQRLQELADELGSRHAVRCAALPVDLAERAGPEQLRARADALGFEPDLLVNNAGLGYAGHFYELPLEDELRMLHLNVEALVALTRLYAPAMVARGSGAIVNVASTAAFQPVPYFSVYAASKAFVVRLSEALWAELHGAGVRVVTVCCGPVDTKFHGDESADDKEEAVKGFLRRRYMTTQRVVDRTLDAVDEDQPMVVLRMPVVGALYYPATLARSLIPRRSRLRVSERINRWVYEAR